MQLASLVLQNGYVIMQNYVLSAALSTRHQAVLHKFKWNSKILIQYFVQGGHF